MNGGIHAGTGCQLTAIRGLSARIGRNPLLAQASSGNISVKIDGILWIKASGKWLIQAEDDDFLLPVRWVGTAGYHPRASIETAMHAVLPYAVVVHVHSIHTICWAVREDGSAELRTRLRGIPWQWIPYTPSGCSLAAAIESAWTRAPETRTFVLGNHGLVVCGEDGREAEDLLTEIEERLYIEPRPAPTANYAFLRQNLDGVTWTLPERDEAHSLSTDPVCGRIVSEGILYPCHAIFLRETVPALHHTRPVLRRLEAHGVLVSQQMTLAEEQMLMGLTNVVRRIPSSARVHYLNAEEVSDILNGGGENYRRICNVSYQPQAEQSKNAG